MDKKIEQFIINNRAAVNEFADTFAHKRGYSHSQALKAYAWIEKNWSDNVLTKMQKETIRRQQNSLVKQLDHLGEMSIREFRHAIEKLTDNKVCVNGGKAYLHIYNWLFKDGKKTCYRCHNYYISIGQNFSRTEENAKMIADKCMKFAAIENYGQNETIPVEKF